ncbi:hypothetical protein CPC08DRAFT_816762 [Agrocybe pediades]|nr:hypothetical protein CPC08DRAFT_816762 [Agrocybe pediades]
MARRSKLRSAKSVAKAAEAGVVNAYPTRPNILNSLKNADRVNGTLVYFYDHGLLDEPLSQESFLQQVHDLAQEHGDHLGPRATAWFERALSGLRTNGYINYLPHRDDNLKFKATDTLLTVLHAATEHRRSFQGEFDSMSQFEAFRAICGYLRSRFQRNKPALTRKEYDRRNILLEHTVGTLEAQNAATEAERRALLDLNKQFEDRIKALDEILKAHNISDVSQQKDPSPALTEPVLEPQSHDRDSMYFDDVAQMGSPSTVRLPHTPIRRSTTFNNPAAYPTPESAPRNLLPPSPRPSCSPTRSQPISSGTHAEATLVDHDMDTDDNEPLTPLPKELELEQQTLSAQQLEDISRLNEILKTQVEELEAKCKLLMDVLEEKEQKVEQLKSDVAAHRRREMLLGITSFFWSDAYRGQKHLREEVEERLRCCEQACKELREAAEGRAQWRKEMEALWARQP